MRFITWSSALCLLLSTGCAEAPEDERSDSATASQIETQPDATNPLKKKIQSGRIVSNGSTPATFVKNRVKANSSQRELNRLRGHKKIVHSVAVSADGSRILSCGGDRVMRVWDVKTGNELLRLKGHGLNIGTLANSSDSQRAISGSWDKTIRMWDLETGRELKQYWGHRWPVLSLAISADASRALSCSDGVRFWDLETGEILHHFTEHSKTVWSVDISSDGSKGISGSWDETVRLWDLESFQELRRFEGHQGRVKCVRFSPDERFAISCATKDPIVRLWNIETGELVREFKGHLKGVISVAFSPDGKRILSAPGQMNYNGSPIPVHGDHNIILWDVESGRELLRLEGHRNVVPSVAFTPDGNRAVSGGGDGAIRIWDLSL